MFVEIFLAVIFRNFFALLALCVQAKQIVNGIESSERKEESVRASRNCARRFVIAQALSVYAREREREKFNKLTLVLHDRFGVVLFFCWNGILSAPQPISSIQIEMETKIKMAYNKKYIYRIDTVALTIHTPIYITIIMTIIITQQMEYGLGDDVTWKRDL